MSVYTQSYPFNGPLTVYDNTAVAALRAVLEQHSYNTSKVTAALGATVALHKLRLQEDLPLHLRRLAAPTHLNTLIKLFILRRALDQASVRAAIAPMNLDHLRMMGLIEVADATVRASVRVSPHDGLLIAHDDDEGCARNAKADHVCGVTAATVTLQHLMVRRPVRRALEIGTGNGVLALKASRHADQVIASDTNPRALNFAYFNAALNEVTNVEWRLGNLFDAVAGERFDLIFSNPPCAISPDMKMMFRDSGRQGDELSEDIIRRVSQHLHTQGFATVLINWVIGRADDWSASLRRWIDGNGCDAWLMMNDAQDPMTYAAQWTRTRDHDAYERELDRWLAYLESLDVTSIGMGAVVMRKRLEGQPWVRADHVAESVSKAAGAHIERLFEAEDRLRACQDDAAFLAERFETARDHQLQQTSSIGSTDEAAQNAEVRLLNGLPFRGSVDPYTLQLLARCDGRRTLNEIANELAVAIGADPAKFASACAHVARHLVATGFLLPASGPPIPPT